MSCSAPVESVELFGIDPSGELLALAKGIRNVTACVQPFPLADLLTNRDDASNGVVRMTASQRVLNTDDSSNRSAIIPNIDQRFLNHIGLVHPHSPLGEALRRYEERLPADEADLSTTFETVVAYLVTAGGAGKLTFFGVVRSTRCSTAANATESGERDQSVRVPAFRARKISAITPSGPQSVVDYAVHDLLVAVSSPSRLTLLKAAPPEIKTHPSHSSEDTTLQQGHDQPTSVLSVAGVVADPSIRSLCFVDLSPFDKFFRNDERSRKTHDEMDATSAFPKNTLRLFSVSYEFKLWRVYPELSNFVHLGETQDPVTRVVGDVGSNWIAVLSGEYLFLVSVSGLAEVDVRDPELGSLLDSVYAQKLTPLISVSDVAFTPSYRSLVVLTGREIRFVQLPSLETIKLRLSRGNVFSKEDFPLLPQSIRLDLLTTAQIMVHPSARWVICVNSRQLTAYNVDFLNPIRFPFSPDMLSSLWLIGDNDRQGGSAQKDGEGPVLSWPFETFQKVDPMEAALAVNFLCPPSIHPSTKRDVSLCPAVFRLLVYPYLPQLRRRGGNAIGAGL